MSKRKLVKRGNRSCRVHSPAGTTCPPDKVEQALRELAVFPVSEGFEERVMEVIRRTRPEKEISPAWPRRFGLTPDVLNAFIAIAATYLFIVSGILNRIVRLGEPPLEARVGERMENLLLFLSHVRNLL